MSLALLFHYLMFNMFRMLIHPSSGACDLFVELFHGLYCPGSMCVGVGCGLTGVVWYPNAVLQPAYGYHTTPGKPQRSNNTHRTRACGGHSYSPQHPILRQPQPTFLPQFDRPSSNLQKTTNKFTILYTLIFTFLCIKLESITFCIE